MGTHSAASPIAPVDLAAEREALGPALEEAVLRVLRSGRYVLGPEVEALERDFAALHGVEHGVAVASGTDALWLGLKALCVEPGDEVVTSPFTFFASAGCIALVGARPVLADVDYETALLDPTKAEAAITSRTSCLLPVHLYGQLADMRAFRSMADARGLRILEDGAQAHGAQRDGYACGQVGDAGTFSFYVTKNLGAAGEGGMVLTGSEETARGLRMLRDHGSPAKYVHSFVGTNSRMHALQAAVLNVKLPHLEAWNARRRELAARYDAAFDGSEVVAPLAPVPGGTHVYHQYTVRIRGQRSRDDVARELGRQGIACGVHYPTPVHVQEAARPWGYGPGDFPVAERLAREVLCLPIHPFLADADADRVAAALLGAAGA
jgi:dTDP-4-amino-4,6-dideoxygalactose transaminase